MILVLSHHPNKYYITYILLFIMYNFCTTIGNLVWERWYHISDIDHLVGPIPMQLKYIACEH